MEHLLEAGIFNWSGAVYTQPKGGYLKPKLLAGQTVYLENERGFFREFSAETQQCYAQN